MSRNIYKGISLIIIVTFCLLLYNLLLRTGENKPLWLYFLIPVGATIIAGLLNSLENKIFGNGANNEKIK